MRSSSVDRSSGPALGGAEAARSILDPFHRELEFAIALAGITSSSEFGASLVQRAWLTPVFGMVAVARDTATGETRRPIVQRTARQLCGTDHPGRGNLDGGQVED